VFGPPAAPSPRQFPRTNRLAIASLACAVAGIPLFGAVTGLVAILLGSLALGAIRHSRQRGTGLALVGVLLGLGDVIGWIVVLAVFVFRGGPNLRVEDFGTDLAALDNLDPTLRRAMRANVLIETHGGWPALGGKAIGSGVVLKVGADEALILTNRHVVDPHFTPDLPGQGEGQPNPEALAVMLIDQSVRDGHVIWTAPGGVDLALVRADHPSAAIQAARWKLGRPLRVGDPLFAIGNPHGLGWTHTQGTLSQFRIQKVGTLAVRLIQTQTVINPGNSGGGLYDREGYLVGINTLTQDKRVSEGLNFAISLDTLRAVPPPGLDLEAGSPEPTEP
jgi:hypothetical protein